MKAIEIRKDIYWTGTIDWSMRYFHGYQTWRGSTYNAYLILDDKITLIDTAKEPFKEELLARISSVIDPAKIDYIVSSHVEPDHSGAIPFIAKYAPNAVIITSQPNGLKGLTARYGELKYQTVKAGDTLSIGKRTLAFVPTPMLHWPDSMVTYCPEEKILFSNDAFGQHFATESLYNDRVCTAELMYEAEKYYANILNPFSAMVAKKIPQIEAMNLPIKLICPSHGAIWKDNPAQIIEKYKQWSDAYQEDQITIVYDTMWQSTRKMAEAIADGIRDVAPQTTVIIMNINRDDKNDALTEMWRSKAVLVGSPTINNGHSFAIAGLLEMASGLKFKNKKAAAFGSYGWGGGAVKQISAKLEEAGFALVNEGLQKLWVPDQSVLSECTEFGRQFAQAL